MYKLDVGERSGVEIEISKSSSIYLLFKVMRLDKITMGNE